MRRPSALPTAFVLFFATLAPGLASASTDVFDGFIQELQAAKLPTGAIAAGASALRGVKFKDESDMGPAAAMYLPFWNEIYLNKSTLDSGTGALKSVAVLGPVDSSVVIHELWHSYYANSFRSGGSDASKLFLNGWRKRYDAYPADEREVIQEEGYALFIQEVSRAYLQDRQILSRSTPDQRKNLKDNQKFTGLYEKSFTDNVYGYYRGKDGMPITVAVPLTEDDKASILSFFFAGKLTGKFAVDFPDTSQPN